MAYIWKEAAQAATKNSADWPVVETLRLANQIADAMGADGDVETVVGLTQAAAMLAVTREPKAIEKAEQTETW